MKKPLNIFLSLIVCVILILIGPRIVSIFVGSGVESLADRAADARIEEGAYYPLRAVAGVQLGHILISYDIDEASGRCRPRYTNKACVNPQADPQLLKERQDAVQEELHERILLLQSGADADDSGFVTVEEGARFRELFEFGHQAANCPAMKMTGPAENTIDNLHDYRKLVDGYPPEIRVFFPVIGESPPIVVIPRTVQERIDADIDAGKPMVVHVVVALCDNRYQGIVPVPESIGNGQDPDSNLYWGAMYGVRSFFNRSDAWEQVAIQIPDDKRILERVVFAGEVTRGGSSVPVHVIADAWDGQHIKDATAAFLKMASEGERHLVAYVGHDGLMDFSLPAPEPVESALPTDAVVLACASKQYFKKHLEAAGAHALLLTTGLMAPEAYTLDAAIRSWAAGGSTTEVGTSAAKAYHHYQKCGLTAAKRLFWGAPDLADHGAFLAPSGPGPYPAFILLHGASGLRPEYLDLAGRFVDSGFAVLVLDYYAGTGGAPIGSEEKLRKWESWRQAVRNGATWLQALPQVQEGRIGLVGFSRGGFLAVSVGASTPGVTAIVEFFGGGGGGTLNIEEEVRGLPPLLILHGEEDRIVPVSFAQTLHDAVLEGGGKVEMQLYPGAGHGFSLPWVPTYSRDSSESAFARTVAFLRENR